MGQMELAYRVGNEANIPAARRLIEQAMKTHLAGFEYQVTFRGG